MKSIMFILLTIFCLSFDLYGESYKLNPKYFDSSISSNNLDEVNKALEKYPLNITPPDGKILLLKKPNSWYKLWGNIVDNESQTVALSWDTNECIVIETIIDNNAEMNFNKQIYKMYYGYIVCSAPSTWTEPEITEVTDIKANIYSCFIPAFRNINACYSNTMLSIRTIIPNSEKMKSLKVSKTSFIKSVLVYQFLFEPAEKFCEELENFAYESIIKKNQITVKYKYSEKYQDYWWRVDASQGVLTADFEKNELTIDSTSNEDSIELTFYAISPDAKNWYQKKITIPNKS